MWRDVKAKLRMITMTEWLELLPSM